MHPLRQIFDIQQMLRLKRLLRPFKPKFLMGSDRILLIRREIVQSSVSSYWQQFEQRIGLGLQWRRLGHLLKGWGGFFGFQPVSHTCSTG